MNTRPMKLAVLLLALGAASCHPSAPEPPSATAATVKGDAQWAFVEVMFNIGRDGKIRDVKVSATDATPALQKKAVARVRSYIPAPEIHNRAARQTIIFHRKTGRVHPMRVEVHSSHRPDGG
ncbi:hypothetical protein OKA04_11205 [Luteolibacter flavescens]|uniref:TonB C-terminal domain-containing protein n=1 Tax=Luteolibacter flavescens TaxID=1859460 RepID=A0ABT3FNZ8_9BACT|nr:hypothetical protein [Luteolibacter flavescens]MCW1885298.1 hypothetical protein [Luteolibacter flavescens]